MKSLIILSLLIGFSAHAHDVKLGNVIAVEREITNIYETCLQHVNTDTSKPARMFLCSYRFTKTNEIGMTKGRAFVLKNDQCDVHAEVMNGSLLVSFATSRPTSNYEISKECLATAIRNSPPVKSLIYAVE